MLSPLPKSGSVYRSPNGSSVTPQKSNVALTKIQLPFEKYNAPLQRFLLREHINRHSILLRKKKQKALYDLE